MLDSNEQSKGGFGAFAARERERRAGLATVSAPTVPTVPPTAAAPIIAEQADGTPAVEPAHAPPQSAAPTGRQPKRWR